MIKYGITREFFIPKGAQKFANEEAAVYLYESGGEPYAVGFVGKRTRPEFNCSYRTEERRAVAVSEFLTSWQRIMRVKREAIRRADKVHTEAANCAAAIRRVLTLAFPTVKFRIRSENFSGGDSVSIHYTDGPTAEAVEALVNVYQEGDFNGMIDLYEYTNRREDMPQAKFIMVTRERSEAVEAAIIRELGITDRNAWVEDSRCYADTLIYRRFRELDLTPQG